MAYPVWINGSEQGCIDPADRGLAYGDGLFETLRTEAGRVLLLDDHMARLQHGARLLEIAVDDQELRRDLASYLSHCPGSCIVKIIITRGRSGRGYLPDPAAVPTRIFSAYPRPEYPESHQSMGIHAGVCSLHLGSQPRLAGIKHLNRLEQVLLRRELEELGKDEALVCNAQGFVVEGVFSNVFMVRAGRLCTPAIEDSGVRGVLRTAILRAASMQGMAVEEGVLTPDDFLNADEIFFCNSVNGIWPVQSLKERYWKPGPISRHWQAFWQELL